MQENKIISKSFKLNVVTEENNAAMQWIYVAQNVMFWPYIATVRYVHEHDNLLLTVRSYKPSHYL
jgi:hypothetical protein